MGFSLKKSIKKAAGAVKKVVKPVTKPLSKVAKPVVSLVKKAATVQAGIVTAGLIKPQALGIKSASAQKLYTTTGTVTKVVGAAVATKGLASMMQGGQNLTPETGVKSLPQNFFKPAVLPGGQTIGWGGSGEVHTEDERAAAFASGDLYGTGLPFGLTVPQLLIGLGGLGLVLVLAMRR